MLIKDGYHETMAFLHAPNGQTDMMQIAVEDHQEKYLAMDRVAERARLIGADQIFYITETWYAPEDPAKPDLRPTESPDRREALMFLAATARGPKHSRQWFVLFSKNEAGDVELGHTEEGPPGAALFLLPVLKVWAELWPDGRAAEDELSSTSGTA